MTKEEHIPNTIGVMPSGISNIVRRLEVLIKEKISSFVAEGRDPENLLFRAMTEDESGKVYTLSFRYKNGECIVESGCIPDSWVDLGIPVGNIVDPVKDQDGRDVFPEPAKP